MADFIIGDYEYTINTSVPTLVSATAWDKSKTSYAGIPSEVVHNTVSYKVTNINNCFKNCTSLVNAPLIPEGVSSMASCFDGCTSLVNPPPIIPSSVATMGFCFRNCVSLTSAPLIKCESNMRYCFQNCTSLVGDVYVYSFPQEEYSYLTSCFQGTVHDIVLYSVDNDIDFCNALAATANNGNVYVNVHPETPISFTDTQMNYMTNEGLKTLSLQTNANLVQCEIPDLVNGGTITTNVNDALIDLYNRELTTTQNGLTFKRFHNTTSVSGTPTEVVSSKSLDEYDLKNIPFATTISLEPNTQYTFVGGNRGNGLNTLIYLYVLFKYSNYNIVASGFFADSANASEGHLSTSIGGTQGVGSRGYSSLTFTTPAMRSGAIGCDIRAYVCYFCPSPAQNINITINPKITEVGGGS